ncbi:hypothetical protein [Ramlibacter montanisoli]|uniref:Antitoxin Xre/MbcA/ParS-like toxin-binding domain-containing protein n=1 Tax=Ramlibacter montanisoli TaxID=2732512 RepID=A0A849KJR0_9BURK|nr:hypothetical protein [Ramlibacter montanisoli]NNU41989.1 hypothetical protein [Ramlibacter montanisoli]
MSDLPVRSAGHRSVPSFLRPKPARHGVPVLLQTAREREYREMEQALRASGGLAGTDHVTGLLAARTDQPISRLARWIVAHEVVSFEWKAGTMLPLFQFDLAGMTLRPEVTAAIRELEAVLNDWEICLWFARPNAWLGDAAPVDCIGVDARALHDAARADRYLARS